MELPTKLPNGPKIRKKKYTSLIIVDRFLWPKTSRCLSKEPVVCPALSCFVHEMPKFPPLQRFLLKFPRCKVKAMEGTATRDAKAAETVNWAAWMLKDHHVILIFSPCKWFTHPYQLITYTWITSIGISKTVERWRLAPNDFIFVIRCTTQRTQQRIPVDACCEQMPIPKRVINTCAEFARTFSHHLPIQKKNSFIHHPKCARCNLNCKMLFKVTQSLYYIYIYIHLAVQWCWSSYMNDFLTGCSNLKIEDFWSSFRQFKNQEAHECRSKQLR